MNLLKQLKTKKYAVAGAAVLAIAVSAVIGINTVKAYASEDYWEVKIGEKTAAVLTSESEAKQVIRDVKNHYVREGAVVKSIQCDPAMTVEMKSYRVSERPEVSTLSEAVDYILSGTREKTEYTIKSGDSLWSISEEYGFSQDEIREMNRDYDFSGFYPGDKLRLYQMKPMVDVTVTQKVTETKQIKFKTVTQTSSEALKNTTVVKQQGRCGEKEVTRLVTTKTAR